MRTMALPAAASSRATAVAALNPPLGVERGHAARGVVLRIHPRWTLVGKRAVDVLGALLGLVALGPLLFAIALWIRLDSPGPALFAHERVGRGGRRFRCLKFRTMRRDAERLLRADPVLLARYLRHDFKLPADEDPRITRAGRFLRRTSLDELPQLLNVLRGDMSLVGPRPVVQPELERYAGRTGLLLSVKPGMTGAWAVSGRSAVGYPARAHLELDYVASWSLWLDLRLLWRTIPRVLGAHGAH